MFGGKHATELAGACMGALTVMLALDLISFRFLERNPDAALRALASLAPLYPATRTELALTIVTILVAAAWEELFYRGVLLALMTSAGLPISAAAIAAAALFGMQHLARGAAGAWYATLFGLIYTSLYLASGSLVPVIAAHAAGNLFTLFYIFPRLEKSIP
ncbi:MAG: CPBP family intramembrane metalloprotease [Caulobacteraceae bacterium]|nr:CPBP family intramembrane metalloprotease [Caulobacteraceae bacterium]